MRRAASSFLALLHDVENELIREWVPDLPRNSQLTPLRTWYPDRWLYASALQKCIRRGLADDAVHVARVLHALDAEYAWRRLRVIALEDVGLGDIKTTAGLLAVAGKRRIREDYGDLHFYAAIVQSLAAASKDRTACDLLCWVDFSPDAVDFRAQLLEAPRQWEPLALDDAAPTWQRTLALQLLAGLTIRDRDRFRTLSRANPDAVRRVLAALSLEPLVAFSVLKGSGTESLNVALAFASHLRQSACVRSIRSQETEVRTPPRIGGFIAPTFCKHTRTGLAALRMLLRRDTALRGILAGSMKRNTIQALGFVLFQVESGLLDRWEDYAPEIRMEAERAELAQFGITDDAVGAELRLLVADRREALNAARREVWEVYANGWVKQGVLL